MAIDQIHKCDACAKEVREPSSHFGGTIGPIGWTRVTITYSAKRAEGYAAPPILAGIAGELLEQYHDRLAQLPVPQTADCDLCDKCGPKLAKFFETLGSPLRTRDIMGLGA